jgi:hypothetical protein
VAGATTHRRKLSDSETLESVNANGALGAGMSSNPRLIYTPCKDATPEGELNALASIYRFILFNSSRKEATRTGGPDDAERSLNEIRAKVIISK